MLRPLSFLCFALALACPHAEAAEGRPKRMGTKFRHEVTLRGPTEPETVKKSASRQGTTPRPAALAFASATRAFDLQAAGFTPYDRYMGSVRTVFAGLSSRQPTATDACRLMRISHSFRYTPRDPYRADLPALTAARGAGDCKAKALWLYDRLGDSRALYVIGKLSTRAKASHAWLYWRYDGRWWILDPTNSSTPIAADTVDRGRYVPYYSFSRGVAYRHPATHLMMLAQVAERTSGRR